ncbi:hypothetical protein HELRODRAFT_169691 [Helobdella robusta]|uniref:DUF4200 domain-containing protein n=1 Tax=Helobdella robusta TaxID=6412 RepID=T1F285_HELRO|nr:hypothetical protein HELRODRAFT_169691 [Helobdella robusta]ESO07974.1 hypothetical protein HELRODRAFT_169691 [Helobdella robusta]
MLEGKTAFRALPLNKEPTYTTTGTKLLEAVKLVEEVEKTLYMKKKDFKMKMKILKFKSNLVKNKETQLKETVAKFNKFVQENDYKKWRAHVKIDEEQQAIKALANDIDTAQSQLISLAKFKEKLLKWTQQRRTFLDFMQKVHQRTSYDFPELRHIIARKETLMAIQEELVNRISAGLDGCENVKNALKKYVELTGLKKRREDIKQTTYDSNIRLNEIYAKVKASSAEVKQIFLCLNSMCDWLVTYEGMQSIHKPADLEKCIEIVPLLAKHVAFFTSVVARVKKDLINSPADLPPCE